MQALDNAGFDWANSEDWEKRKALIEMRKRDLEHQMRQEREQQAFAGNQQIGQMVGRRFVPTNTKSILAANLALALALRAGGQ